MPIFFAIALGVVFIVAPTEAAAAAVSGCIAGTSEFVLGPPSRWGVPMMYEVCDYRTSLGTIIHDLRTGAWYPLYRNWWYV